ncbi:hypothetical protein [Marivita hallyeonensis]|uniref:Uncharacterized protein n=1 Tax=Marivita hallyeonensis TaxID=996342 RepID=A0A1M5XTD3_9RHOB|nr:hypothetical protein [Marivita hallyeonensis]SHI03071.1 hypothetical protein SAMN05443551_4132 [Marivita hallyeonensis]
MFRTLIILAALGVVGASSAVANGGSGKTASIDLTMKKYTDAPKVTVGTLEAVKK